MSAYEDTSKDKSLPTIDDSKLTKIMANVKQKEPKEYVFGGWLKTKAYRDTAIK